MGRSHHIPLHLEAFTLEEAHGIARGVREYIVLLEYEPILDGLGSTVEQRIEMGRQKNHVFFFNLV